VTEVPNGRWFDCLPGCEVQVPCGQDRHAIRWEAGSLLLPEHRDAEAELVLAALGGEKARCVELAEAWGRHVADLSVLAIGPRGPDDDVDVTWDDVAEAAAQASDPGVSFLSYGAPTRPALARLASPPGSTPPSVAAMRRQIMQEAEQARQRRMDMLSLLALGYGFQVRLAGHVAAAHEDSPGPAARPALAAAIAGRLAPVAERWLGIDPAQVVVSPHHGPGWGSVELTGRGQERRLQVSLPTGWLTRVWACGLALAGGHLVVAVQRAGWPDAQVLGLRAPGAEPVPLQVHGTVGPGSPRDVPHWKI
jgi:hypothetical protein